MPDKVTIISVRDPPGVTKGFNKGKALNLLRTNSSHRTFECKMELTSLHDFYSGIEPLDHVMTKFIDLHDFRCYLHVASRSLTPL